MENISYPRYLGKSMKIEPEERLSSCRIEIRPVKNSRSVAPPPGTERFERPVRPNRSERPSRQDRPRGQRPNQPPSNNR